MAANKDSVLAVVHEFLFRKDRNLASVFKSKYSSVRKKKKHYTWWFTSKCRFGIFFHRN